MDDYGVNISNEISTRIKGVLTKEEQQEVMKMKLAPLGDKVVLKQVEAQETTKSGIVLTSQTKEKPQEGIVVAVGPGGMVGDTKIEMVVKEGDHVLYSKYGAMEVKFEGEEYLIMRQNDILAIIKD